MNILVTGGKGQLGCSLQKISSEYSSHTFVFTDMPEADITDMECMTRLIGKYNVDIIVNCAAYTAVDKAENDEDIARKINRDGVKVLADMAKKYDVKLVHISTDYVFSGEHYHPLHEDQVTEPVGVYGKTKLEGEREIEKSGCNAAIIRTAWLYSEFGNNFLKTMLRLGKERDSLNVVYDQVGTPTYATDLAYAIMKVVESGINGLEVYHFSNEGAVSWYDFAKEIFAEAGIDVHVSAIESYLYPMPAKRPAYSVLSKDKIKTIGVSVPYWKDSMKKCLNILLEEKI